MRFIAKKYKERFVIHGYRRGAANYDRERFPWEKGCLGQVEKEKISKFLKNSSILECGIGTGRHALAFGDRYSYFGADLSREMIKVCRRKTNDMKVDIVLSDAECLPFRKGVFDNVICSKTFKFLNSPVRFLREARGSLRKGGRCIITFEVLDSMWFRLVRKLGLKVPKHEKHYFSNDAVAIFQKAGFSIVQLEPVANLFLGFYLFCWYMLYPTPLSQGFRRSPSLLSKVLVELDKRVKSKFLVLVSAEA